MADEEEGKATTKHFWTSLPGILTGVTGILSALTAFYVAVFGRGGPAPEPPRPAIVETADRGANVSAKTVIEEKAPRPTPAREPADPFVLTAVIEDPDGFANVRARRSPSSAVLARVNRDEEFSTYRQEGVWWQVRTRDGTIGFMHASRIRIVRK